ncbi:hypothetical protein [Roseobacter sp.]|uniref:hypothetical protein n=1 Tax=Roseobacter sp. TaxID=1907202 RepID=UPI00296612BC|nr:hypothetical protein [Roseobacter sp.]MDW3184134.1 hypothetical protein [Roseobacter sp.]
MADALWAVNSIVLSRAAGQTGRMISLRCLVVLGVGLLVWTACAPLSIYHREGVPVSRMQSDLLACEISALADAPVANQIRRDPPRYIPGRRYCRADGSCYRRGGYYVPGEIYTVDVNRTLRARAEQQCMANQGYVPATIPNCPNGVSRAAPPGATQVLPRLSAHSCAIRNDDGSWQIVTQAG